MNNICLGVIVFRLAAVFGLRSSMVSTALLFSRLEPHSWPVRCIDLSVQ